MSEQVNEYLGVFNEIRQDVKLLKSSVPEEQKDTFCELFDGFLWFIDKLIQPSTRKISPQDHVRLQRLLKRLETSRENVAELQRVTMELGQLAPPNDDVVLKALENLLHHRNTHLRINACQSLGRVGGEQTKKVLQELLKSDTPQIRRAALNGLYVNTMGLLAEKLRPLLQELGILRREKRDLIELLSEKYSTRTLFLCSGGFLIAFMASLFAHYSLHVTIIHPAISFIGVIASVSFLALSIWRHKHE